MANGLSSNLAVPLLEDREGNVWVGTNLGLDRFRAAGFVAQADIPATSPDGYLAAFDRDGAMYVADSTSLRRIGADGVAHVVASMRTRPRALCPSGNGSLWLASEPGLQRIGMRGLEAIAIPRAISRSAILSCQEDIEGGLCISALCEGIFRRSSRGWSRVTVPGQPAQVSPYLMIEDRQGRMWLNYLGRPLVMIEGGRVRRYGAAEGLGVGDIGIVYPRASSILVGGNHGIARFDGRRFRSLTASANPLRRITGIAETARGETWLNGIGGIVRVATPDLDAALDRPGATPHWDMLDFQEAFYTNLGPGHYRFHVIASNNDGVWNRCGATLDLTIPPTFLQSISARRLSATPSIIPVARR